MLPSSRSALDAPGARRPRPAGPSAQARRGRRGRSRAGQGQEVLSELASPPQAAAAETARTGGECDGCCGIVVAINRALRNGRAPRALARRHRAAASPELASRAKVVARANGREPMAALAAAGVGITCLPRMLGDALPQLRLLATPVPGPLRKLWLGVHRDARAVPRVRATIECLVQGFSRLHSALCPVYSGQL